MVGVLIILAALLLMGAGIFVMLPAVGGGLVGHREIQLDVWCPVTRRIQHLDLVLDSEDRLSKLRRCDWFAGGPPFCGHPCLVQLRPTTVRKRSSHQRPLLQPHAPN